jgi:uncharacterized membrane protein YdjX (TVP38/TMEM64 family)
MDALKLSIPKKKFFLFVSIILLSGTVGLLTFRWCLDITPERFNAFIVSLGLLGPAIYISIFIIRPFFLISSIALFIAGGLAFGPVWGPSFAVFGIAIGGSLGFLFARLMGHEYVYGLLKKKKNIIENQNFSFSIVFLLSLLPIMPITIINLGAGLSAMKYRPYIISHILGVTPRAFAYGFFGSTLFAAGTLKFYIALAIIALMAVVTAYFARKSKKKAGG